MCTRRANGAVRGLEGHDYGMCGALLGRHDPYGKVGYENSLLFLVDGGGEWVSRFSVNSVREFRDFYLGLTALKFGSLAFVSIVDAHVPFFSQKL